MRGHAFLTSSAETEAAQESDRIGASYFTHYLISGLRGAADVNGEGKVTLNEAYQFAFNETLGRTVDTKGGAQHPSYDINLSGTGDVVMTDLRQTSATLVIDAALDGRFFVRNARQELVVELYKPYGRRVELALEPGDYEVRVEREAAALLAKPRVDEGARVVLDAAQFSATTPEQTRRRGEWEPPPFAVTGRNRLDLRLGMWNVSGPLASGITTGSEVLDLVTGLRYTRYLREDLAVAVDIKSFAVSTGESVGAAGIFSGSQAIVAIPLEVRFNPLSGVLHTRSVKPYLAAGVGPVIGASEGSSIGAGGIHTGSRTEATVGGPVGVGVDFHLSRHFTLGVNGGYIWMADFSAPIGGRDNYSGFELSLSIGWLFGKGSPPRE
jgi:hypothetical protein